MARLHEYGEPPVYRNPDQGELDSLSQPNAFGVTVTYLMHADHKQVPMETPDVEGYWVGTAIVAAFDKGSLVAKTPMAIGGMTAEKRSERLDTAIRDSQDFVRNNTIGIIDGKRQIIPRPALVGVEVATP